MSNHKNITWFTGYVIKAKNKYMYKINIIKGRNYSNFVKEYLTIKSGNMIMNSPSYLNLSVYVKKKNL